ncbi:sunset domain-containing protein [Devosia riboflavina]
MASDKGASILSKALASFGQNCSIKGNVSVSSGEHIYHLPGQEYYASTTIRPLYDERWFCSEAAARGHPMP